ncbi:hypothetical protein KIN20_028035 [Parelaphostrongylus tenuis]|uniref:Secreted protein n=1 Tax=Parelaphostrongylus tenuis TaxID=148309 RepID=A0AAD5WED1_PARTN|nr:hypothetical protein KIN20_028035 [Parelaphostrongylus tenuis]
MNVIRPFSNSFVISLLATISAVLGCGVMPVGQVSTRSFTVTGFTLPAAMTYSADTAVTARVAGMKANKEAVQAFVLRLVMQTVFDVLERQGRSALLPDAVISEILSQLSVNITYEPLQCHKVALDPANDMQDMNMDSCIIVDNTVTGICKNDPRNGMMKCNTDMAFAAVNSKHLTLSGTLTTRNNIMANWSRAMWQSVLNRAVRTLALGPYRSNFFSASGSIVGN